MERLGVSANIEDKGHGLHLMPMMERGLALMRTQLRSELIGVAVPDDLVLEHGDILDQAVDGTCVGHADAAWHNCKPRGFKNQIGHEEALKIYDAATLLDPFTDNDLDRSRGTTTQAGLQAMARMGLLNYPDIVWASSLDEISAFIRGGFGPVLVGSNWYKSMFYPTADNFIRVYPETGRSGGHEWIFFGVTHDSKGEIFWAQQSWGYGFADNGIMYFRRQGLQRLADLGMEAAGAIQTGIFAG
jgi:hypothetical protein